MFASNPGESSYYCMCDLDFSWKINGWVNSIGTDVGVEKNLSKIT